MQAPDHDAVESSRAGFKDNKIAYAAFVEPSAVVDHQHVPRSSLLQRFQEDVDAAGVSSRDHTPGQAASWNDSMQRRGGAAHWGLSANARICQVGGGQGCKPPPSIFGIHSCSLTPPVTHQTHGRVIATSCMPNASETAGCERAKFCRREGQARSARLLDDGPGLDLDLGTERERGGREG